MADDTTQDVQAPGGRDLHAEYRDVRMGQAANRMFAARSIDEYDDARADLDRLLEEEGKGVTVAEYIERY